MGPNKHVIQWGDPYTNFVGNVNGSDAVPTGYGIYYPVIAAIARSHGDPYAGGGEGYAPGTVYEANGKRIFVLPGVPLEMKGIFTEELEPQFLAAGSAATVRELRFTFAVEARFYPLMRELEGTFPDVSVGSYPNFETKELVIRVLGSDPKRVDEALDVIRKRAPV